MNNLIEEMKSSWSSIQHLLQKFNNINFNEYWEKQFFKYNKNLNKLIKFWIN